MIHYALRCAAGHEFDGWFSSSASFDAQATSGLLDCPLCGNAEVRRALMAPRVNTRPAAAPQQTPESTKAVAVPAAAPAPTSTAVAALPDQVRAVLQRIRAEVEQKCEYVGPAFPEAARRMHLGDQPARAIYGEATADEAAALAEDGIDVTRIPWVPRADS
jgi:hypothetical protein